MACAAEEVATCAGVEVVCTTTGVVCVDLDGGVDVASVWVELEIGERWVEQGTWVDRAVPVGSTASLEWSLGRH